MRRFTTVVPAIAGIAIALGACNQIAGIDSGIPAAGPGGARPIGTTTGLGGATSTSAQASNATAATSVSGTSATEATASTATSSSGAGTTVSDASASTTDGSGGSATIGSAAGTGGASSASSGAGAASATSGSGGCAPGFDDCDNTGSCQTNLTNTLDHCGMCTTACASPHATWSCTSSACAFVECQTGYADCNGNHDLPDGCETSLNDPNNCGMCKHGCESGVCQAQTCAPVVVYGPLGPSANDEPEGANYFIANRVYVPIASTLLALGASTTTVGIGIRFAIYKEVAGAPGAPNGLLAQTSALTTINGATEGTVTKVSLPVGYYWIAFVASASVRVRIESGMVQRLSAPLTYGTFPDPPPALTGGTLNAFDLYAKVVQP